MDEPLIRPSGEPKLQPSTDMAAELVYHGMIVST